MRPRPDRVKETVALTTAQCSEAGSCFVYGRARARRSKTVGARRARATRVPTETMTETQAGQRLPEKRDAPADRTQFPCFDGFRAIAAMCVLVFHTGFVTGYTLRNHAFGLPFFLSRLDLGVAIFFLVSAFLLYRPFARPSRAADRARGAIVLSSPAATHPACVLGRAHRARPAERGARCEDLARVRHLLRPGADLRARALARGHRPDMEPGHRVELLRVPPGLRVGARTQGAAARAPAARRAARRAGAVRDERRLPALHARALPQPGRDEVLAAVHHRPLRPRHHDRGAERVVRPSGLPATRQPASRVPRRLVGAGGVRLLGRVDPARPAPLSVRADLHRAGRRPPDAVRHRRLLPPAAGRLRPAGSRRGPALPADPHRAAHGARVVRDLPVASMGHVAALRVDGPRTGRHRRKAAHLGRRRSSPFPSCSPRPWCSS